MSCRRNFTLWYMEDPSFLYSFRAQTCMYAKYLSYQIFTYVYMSGIDAVRGFKGIRLRLDLSSCNYRRLTTCPTIPFCVDLLAETWSLSYSAAELWHKTHQDRHVVLVILYLSSRARLSDAPWVYVCDTAELTAPRWSHSSGMLSQPGLQINFLSLPCTSSQKTDTILTFG